jgi:hypothetical protein
MRAGLSTFVYPRAYPAFPHFPVSGLTTLQFPFRPSLSTGSVVLLTTALPPTMNLGFKHCAVWALLSASAFAQDAATQREARERWFLRGHTSAPHAAGSCVLGPKASLATSATRMAGLPLGHCL